MMQISMSSCCGTHRPPQTSSISPVVTTELGQAVLDGPSGRVPAAEIGPPLGGELQGTGGGPSVGPHLSSPLSFVKSFEELRLKLELLKGVYGMGFNRPSKIQENALPMMLAYPPQNLSAQSQSGTGKTAAFSLAMLTNVNPDNKWMQCLCLAPTHELALQIGQVIEQMGQFCLDVKLAYAIRGNRVEQSVKLQEQIVIGMPGTLLDWCVKYKVIDLKKICMFVLDEADVMIATQGFWDQSIRIQRALSKEYQMLFFSATFEESLWEFAERVIPEPNIIRLKREEETLHNIKQFYMLCNNKEGKLEALHNLYGTLTIAQTIIFCQTRATAAWLCTVLEQEGHQVELLSGESADQRAAVIKRFRSGKEKVLVTTNVCSRSIDVEQVSIVVNFDFLENIEGIGRSGGFGKRGFAVNMVDSSKGLRILRQIEKLLSGNPEA